jgi:hypothetical protein
VLNDAGELVGINVGAILYQREQSRPVITGIAWALYGPWGEIPEQYREEIKE